MIMMWMGDKGEDVRQLQLLLQITADGEFGPKTKEAVRKFQEDNGLVADGIAGPKVMALLAKRKPTRPALRKLADSLARAWHQTTQKARYILGEGGRNPANLTPFTPNAKGALGSDCVGFVLWCLGIDRYQPELFGFYDGWMNTDSIIMDAKYSDTYVQRKKPRLWKLLNRPEVGSLVIFPSLRNSAGKMTRMGHVGIVVEVPAEWPEDLASWSPKERRELLKLVKVIDCNASLSRKLSGKAIGQLTAATSWDKPDAVWVGWAG